MSSIIQPGAIQPPAEDAPFVRLPVRKHAFRRGADRLRQLANGHPLEPFLLFLSEIARAQQDALDRPEAAPPEVPKLSSSAAAPVFPVDRWVREPAWRELLTIILDTVEDAAPAPGREAVQRIRGMDRAALEGMARQILSGDNTGLDAAAAPLVASALQVYWTALASSLEAESPGAKRISRVCPVCASPPVASVVRLGGQEQGLRYLHCSLCGSEWHLPRLTCSNCESTTALQFLGIEGQSEAIKAEACGDCRSYLKIMYMNRDLDVDPVADDLATLALDMLMAEEGFRRSGPNLLFVPGEEVEHTH